MSEYGEDSFNISTKVQHSGVLLKRPFGHQSHKWSKRFFVLKEGFLLYYTESEKKGFEKRGHLNIHPKGVIPLGGCTIAPVCDMGQEYAIHIKSNEFNNGFVAIAADNHYEREKWLQMLQEAGRITWKNTQLGESLIRQLENQGLQLCRERQDYFDKLQEEANALRIEIDKNEELGRMASELDEEKKKLETMMTELKLEHESIRNEYETTLSALSSVNEEKLHLRDTTAELQDALKELAEEKEAIVTALSATEAENSKLNHTQESLQSMLRSIEDDTKLLLEEKQEVEERCKTNELHAQLLAEEKKLISDHALTLESSMQDLIAQKVLTETELKEEILARINAEKRLKNAEEALHHLENVIRAGHNNMNVVREEIMPDVRRLKKFFEDVAEEAKIDANKPIIMKNAVLARKKYMQIARTQKLQTKRTEKAKSLGFTLESSEPSGRGLHRSLSTIVTNRENSGAARPSSSLLRTLSTRTVKPSRHLRDNDRLPTTNSSQTSVNSVNIDGDEVTIRRQLSVVQE